MSVRRDLVGDLRRHSVDADEIGAEGFAGGRLEDRLDRPVLPRGEGRDRSLALDDQADRDGLDPTGREAALDLLAQERAEGVADEPIHDPACLLGVDEVLVDIARVGERLADRRFR